MRAWRVHELGDPDHVLVLEDDVPDPVPGPGEVLVDVEAAALNFSDVLLCRGRYQERPPLPFVPGFEVAGRVAGTGERVVGLCRLPAGGLAQRTVLADPLPVPDTMSATDAAAMSVTYLTAHLALHRRARLAPGETVLVHAGAGGVGSATIQLAKAAGARVVATAGGADKVALCRELGADLALDHREGDFVDPVREFTGGRGADVIVDPVGGDTFDRSRRAVAFEGRILVVGFGGGRVAELPTNHALVKTYAVLGLNLGGYRTHAPDALAHAHAAVLDEYARGTVSPLVSEVLTLEQVPDGLARLHGRGTVGKLVVALS
ncbi:alcohol dehydrogenase [Actinophytocola xinjiangensis]|uniref:Alcohol dehydrogenase n=1 Tax=Actinophytocola xinjiangensis TaxID=485602 RepID=A0A7Z0WNE9_9PSEU|nr:NADPH:quinone oxidoreductase family protein [Actinophytocola xinjiangensis]OLF11562.1 alcohol dehydrogenase [Actinophytocola xinjiangensis]